MPCTDLPDGEVRGVAPAGKAPMVGSNVPAAAHLAHTGALSGPGSQANPCAGQKEMVPSGTVPQRWVASR